MAKKILDSEYEYERKADGSIEVEGDREDAHWKTVRTVAITGCVASCFYAPASWLVTEKQGCPDLAMVLAGAGVLTYAASVAAAAFLAFKCRR